MARGGASVREAIFHQVLQCAHKQARVIYVPIRIIKYQCTSEYSSGCMSLMTIAAEISDWRMHHSVIFEKSVKRSVCLTFWGGFSHLQLTG